MKKKCYKFLCFLIIMFLSINIKVSAMNRLEIVVPDVEPPTSYAEVYDRIIAWQEKIPTGTPWDYDNPYGINGYLGRGYISKDGSSAGSSCVAFSLILSDAAFGDLPSTKYTSIKFEDIRVGDILRLYDNYHSVIVTETGNDYIIVAEGNVQDGIVRWGYVMSKDEVMDNFTYLQTRYPEGFVDGVENITTPVPTLAPTPAPTSVPTSTSVPTYKYAKKQRVKKSYRYLYDSEHNEVDMFELKNGKLTYKGKKLPLKTIKWADFNQSGTIIAIQKKGIYYSIKYTKTGIEIKKLGKEAEKRQKKNGLIVSVITKHGKVNVANL